MSQLYDDLALYYDLAHADYTADLPFYLKLAQETGGPILELGCGSGRTIAPLLEASFEVVGLDNSQAMLELAARRLGEQANCTLVLGDMTSFDLGRTFPLITSPFNTWLHLNSLEAQKAAFHRACQHLAPGGWLVIDIPAPATIVEAEHDGALTLEKIFAEPESGDKMLQFASTQLDSRNQLYYVTWIYDRIEANGVVKRKVAPMTLRYLLPKEARSLVRGAGLKLKALWGDYERSPYTAESEKLIIVAEKPTG